MRTGGREVWAVLFRHGGKQTSKAFDTEPDAADFKALVDRFGPERTLRYHAEENPERQAGTTLDQLYELWIADKDGDVTPHGA